MAFSILLVNCCFIIFDDSTRVRREYLITFKFNTVTGQPAHSEENERKSTQQNKLDLLTYTDQVSRINLFNDIDDPADGEEAARFISPTALLSDQHQFVQQTETPSCQLVNETLTTRTVRSISQTTSSIGSYIAQ